MVFRVPKRLNKREPLLSDEARQAERLRKHYGVRTGEAKPLDRENEERLKSLGFVQ